MSREPKVREHKGFKYYLRNIRHGWLAYSETHNPIFSTLSDHWTGADTKIKAIVDEHQDIHQKIARNEL